MSTLAEIEAAVDALSLEQKQELLRFLASRVNGADTEKDLTDLTQFSGVIRLPEDPLAWQRGALGLGYLVMTCIGKVSKGKVVLPDGINLADGTTVRVDTVEAESASRLASNAKFSEFIGMADDLPSDLAENLDHYLHGHPKK
jgi:hypothetical protein